MGISTPKTEEIVVKLRQIEVLTGQGMPRLDAIRQIGVTEKNLLSLELKRLYLVRHRQFL